MRSSFLTVTLYTLPCVHYQCSWAAVEPQICNANLKVVEPLSCCQARAACPPPRGEGVHLLSSLGLVAVFWSSWSALCLHGMVASVACRDGANPPMVCVHWKAFLTHKCSSCKWICERTTVVSLASFEKGLSKEISEEERWQLAIFWQ